MKKRQFFSRLIAVTVTLSLICSASLISVYAASGTKYEVESNNTIQTANRTLNDYDNFGKIDQFNDNDYWFITFASEGMANFWLGDIPSGCDYDLYVYEKLNGSDNVDLIAASQNSSNSQEFLRIHVENFGTATYYVRIFSPLYHYSSSYYKMRIKNSAGISAQFYSYTSEAWTPFMDEDGNYQYWPVDTHSLNENTRQILRQNGFVNTDLDMINKPSSTIISNMPFHDVIVIESHGDAGLVVTPTGTYKSHLYAVSPPFITSYDSTLASLSSGALSNVSLIILASCNSGSYDSQRGSLVEQAYSKGALNVIGWKYPLDKTIVEYWLAEFFQASHEGIYIRDAIDIALDRLSDMCIHDASLLQMEYGLSNFLDSTILP